MGLSSWTTQTRQHNDANEVDDDNDHSDPPSATAISNWKDPEFDANGSATKAPIPGSEALAEHEYVFDAFDRMVAVKQAGEVIAEYRYDGLGRRTRKFAKQSATTNWDVWEYYYGAGWQVVQVRKDTVDRGSNPTTDPVLSTTLKEEYLYHPVYIDAIALRVRDTDADGDIDELDDPEYYTQDANMNVTALLDASGAVLERYDYDAYGKVTFLDASFQNPSGASSHENDILFADRRLDLETQLYHFRLRQYHPTLGRFVSRDPIGVWGDPGNAGNAYAYVGGNPVNGLDPMGLFDVWNAAGRALQAVGGAAEVALGGALLGIGAAASTTGVGTAPGLGVLALGTFLIGHGADSFQAGILGGPTIGGQVAKQVALDMGADQTGQYYAELAYDLAGAGGSMKAGARLAAAKLNCLSRSRPAALHFQDGVLHTVPRRASDFRFPNSADEFDELLGFPGTRRPDMNPQTGQPLPGRGRVDWDVSTPQGRMRITFEQHPYHANAPEFHRGPHFHVDIPGTQFSHARFSPGDKIPGS